MTGSSTLVTAVASLENKTGSSTLVTAVDTNTSLRAKAKGTLSFSGTLYGSITLSNNTNSSTPATPNSISTGQSLNHMGPYSFYQINITFSTNISNNYQVLIQDASSTHLMSSRVINKSASGFSIQAFFHGGGAANYSTWELDFVVI